MKTFAVSSMIAGKRLVFAGALVVSALGVPAVASADGSRADALFKQGRSLLDSKKYDEACPKLAESQQLEPGAGTLLALALCHEGQGKTATAWAELKDAAELGRKHGRGELAKAAEKRAEAMEPTLSRVVVRMPETDTSDYEVTLDGKAFARDSWGSPYAVDPGEHRVAVRAQRKGEKSYVVRLTGAGTVEIVVDPLDEAGASGGGRADRAIFLTSEPPTDPERQSRGGTQRTIGLIVAGAGLVGYGVAAYYGGRALSAKSDAREICPSSPCEDEADATEANDNSRRFFNRSMIGVAVGTGLLATGAILFLTAPRNTPVRGSAPPSRRTARIVPQAGPSQVGLGLAGTF